MGMVVRNNLMALNANRQLGSNTSAVQKSLEKLSSGFKINRAGDDASGLAISEKMKAQIKGLETASANSQDGISLIQTAEGALTEVHDMLNRMVELTEKSANGTIQDEVDRENIQNEVNALLSEIDRIGDSTNFNGINLIDGNLAGGASGAGALTGGVVSSFKSATTGDVAGKDMSTFASFNNKETIKVDGVDIEVDWSKLSADDQAALKKNWTTGISTSEANKAAEILQNTINNAIDNANKTRGTGVAHVEVKGSQAAGVASFKITSGMEGSKDSAIEISKGADGVMGQMVVGSTASVTGSKTYKVDGGTFAASKQIVIGDKTWKAVTTDAGSAADEIGVDVYTDFDSFMNQAISLHNASNSNSVASYNSATGELTISEKVAGTGTLTTSGTFTGFTATEDTAKAVTGVAHADAGADTKVVAEDKFNAGDVADVNGVNFDLVLGGEKFDIQVNGLDAGANKGEDNARALKNAIDATLDKYADAKGLNTEERQALKDNLTVEFTKDGKFNITNNSGMTLAFQDKNGGKAAELLGIGGATGSVSSGGLTLQVGDTADDFNKVTVSVDNMKTDGLGIAGLDVSNQTSAGAAIQTIKSAINKVSVNRGNLGALQNRLEHTISNLDVSAENMTAANSRIRDTDMAKEMMNYTKMNVLTQAAQAMLAQANQQPQSILQLLQ